jgi:diaminopimelate epimerase
VNFVSRSASSQAWRYRTFERGVEAETLACGTGAVAIAILLNEWGETRGDVVLETKSGEQLTVRLKKVDGGWEPTLRGPARIVFEGQLREI